MNDALFVIWFTLIIIAVELGMIAARLGKILSDLPDLREVEEQLGDIRSSISTIEMDIGTVAGNSESIESAVSASVRKWPDDYRIKVEAFQDAKAQKAAKKSDQSSN